MFLKIYYILSGIFFKLQVRRLGKNTELRFKGRVIGGKHITIGDNVRLDSRWLMAVFPFYAKKENPVNSNGKGIIIGNGTSSNRNLTIYCAEYVNIGNNCMLGGGVLITDNNHGMNAESELFYQEQSLTSKEVIIGDGCWIAQDCLILAGSHIGEKCIIAANSVVTGDIPPYSIAAGSPASVIAKWDFRKHCWQKIKRG